jgi:hypothetical protein
LPYGPGWSGLSGAPEGVARSIVDVARGEVGGGAQVLGLTGKGIEVL